MRLRARPRDHLARPVRGRLRGVRQVRWGDGGGVAKGKGAYEATDTSAPMAACLGAQPMIARTRAIVEKAGR